MCRCYLGPDTKVSLEATARERRGTGVRHRLTSNYLCKISNNVELFEYISGDIAQFIFEAG